MPRIMICWVVRLNRLYLLEWNVGGVKMDRDLQRAFRYQSERDAAFVAKKICGEVVKCQVRDKGLEVIRE